jgi:hypothetical protein
MQTCLRCGCERVSKVSFDGPRYTRTQESPGEFDALTKRTFKPFRMRWFRSAA